MDDQAECLARIAAALERLAPPPQTASDWANAPAFVWDGLGTRAIASIEAPPLELLRGIDGQKATVAANVARLAKGHAAHDMLLWGARGMGKSALIRAAVAAAQEAGGDVALVQVSAGAVESLPQLIAQLADVARNFLVFIDDLGFAAEDDIALRQMRSWLDGGVDARPANVRLAVTSNHRAILPRDAAEQGDPIAPRDAVDDRLALADRFGLSLGFHNAGQDDFLAMLHGYAAHHGLTFDEADALEWAKRRGARSGRVAWHYMVELAGRAGRNLQPG